MKRALTQVIAITLYLIDATSAHINRDAFKTMEEIAAENGFATESYTLQTSDGYGLTLYRIPGTFTDMNVKKPAVLMMHAQDCDMMQWVWNDSERANAFILARAGYDVWMGNNRGTKYGMVHATLDRHEKEFWDFYMEEMGLIDTPMFIDFILEKTGLEQLSYVGHSEGTTQMFLGASLNPTYFKEKINLYIALAPVASTVNMGKTWMTNHLRLIQFVVVDVLKYYNWFAPMPEIVELVEIVCDIFPSLTQLLRKKFIHNDVDNLERFDVFLSNEPSGQSYRTFIYYQQMRANERVALYDYGKIKNLKLYGTAEPPLVPLEQYDIPTAFFSGDIDHQSVPADVAWLAEQLGDNIVFNQQYHMDHFSFMLAKDMTFFSEDAVNLLKQYNTLP